MKVVALTDILTLYWVFLFGKIAEQLNKDGLRVLARTDKDYIHSWKYEKPKREYSELLIGKAIVVGGYDFLFSLEKMSGYKNLIIVPFSAGISLNDASAIKDWQVAA